MCPWNVKFARTLRDGSPFAARAFLAGKDAATLAREHAVSALERITE